MSKSEDQSVPIGSDWNTSKSIVKKKQQEIRMANLPPVPPLPPSDEILPPNARVVRIKFIGNKMKFGFAILFVVWDGVESMEEYSWLLIYPGITFTITLFALNFFGDGLRDALDPKTTDN